MPREALHEGTRSEPCPTPFSNSFGCPKNMPERTAPPVSCVKFRDSQVGKIKNKKNNRIEGGGSSQFCNMICI